MRETIIAICAALFLTSCGTGRKIDSDTRPTVAVSIAPQKYWVDRLTGGTVHCEALVGRGAGHSTYEPLPGQMREIAKAKAYFAVGNIDFELVWLPKFREANPEMKVIDLSQSVTFPHISVDGTSAAHSCPRDGFASAENDNHTCRHTHGDGCSSHESVHLNCDNVGHSSHDDHDGCHHHHGLDPHTWTCPPMAREMVQAMSLELKKIVPHQADSIDIRLASLLGDIDSIDAYIRAGVASANRREFLLFHPALTWFAATYGLRQSVVEIGGKEPSPAQMGRLIDTIRQIGITTLIVQAEYPHQRAEAIAEQTGARIERINPLGYNWMEEMRVIADVVVESLK